LLFLHKRQRVNQRRSRRASFPTWTAAGLAPLRLGSLTGWINTMSNSFIIKAFVYKNKNGGTNAWRAGVKSDSTPNFKGVAIVTVDPAFTDYETARQYIGTAKSPDLKDYLEKCAHPADQQVCFSGFDIVKEEVTKDELAAALEALYNEMLRPGDSPADAREVHKKLHAARTLLLALGRLQKK
jgi:hypothetical protein